MAETALRAAMRAVHDALTTGSPIWGDRVYPYLAPATVGAEIVRPYVVYWRSAGGEANSRVQQDAELVLVVKCVAETLDDAMLGDADISSRLNDKGLYDTTSPVNGGSDWTIQTTTREMQVDLHELVDSVDIYHQGADYRFVMQRR